MFYGSLIVNQVESCGRKRASGEYAYFLIDVKGKRDKVGKRGSR